MAHAVLDSAHEIPRLDYFVCDRDRNKLELGAEQSISAALIPAAKGAATRKGRRVKEQAFKSDARFALTPPEILSM
jgi:hypothetical protein